MKNIGLESARLPLARRIEVCLGDGGECQSFLSHLPNCSEVLNKVGVAEQEHPAQEKDAD